jgi:hypothetical protein
MDLARSSSRAPPIAPDDTRRLTAGCSLEHVIYPAALHLLAAGRLRLDGRRVIIEGPLPPLPPPMAWLP